MSLIDKVFRAFVEALHPEAPKTLCCNVSMHDVWQHADDCPNFIGAMARLQANGSTFARKRGDKSGMCPHCGYPTGFYGLYTVGERCSWCGYVEPCSDS